jgi:hypothetical protein
MGLINKDYLKTLYLSYEISRVWRICQNEKVIEHSQLGLISPNELRSYFANTPCPFCGEIMVHGKKYSTSSQSEAIARGYQYINKENKKSINRAGNTYFHPNYITLDHKMNKARFPDLMFECSNLKAVCWRCNQEKGDNNNYEVELIYDSYHLLAKETLEKFKPL